MFAKVDVKDLEAHITPFFVFNLRRRKAFWEARTLKWNFTKFLVGRNGEVWDVTLALTTKPEALEADIEKALASK